MSHGYVCAAGLRLLPLGEQHRLDKPATHIRPVMRSRLSVAQLRQAGGAFEVGAVVRLDKPTPVGRAPELEDWLFRAAEYRRAVSPEAFWGALQQVSKPTLAEIFGPELSFQDRSAVVPVGRGSASLGVFNPPERARLLLNHEGKLRLRVLEAGHLSLSVTDVRFYTPDSSGWTLDVEKVERVSQRIYSGESLLLSVGLTRAFQKSAEKPSYHWLQVNNLHLESTPLW